MSYRLSNREETALEIARIETEFLNGDFFPRDKLGPGIGAKTIRDLVTLGLIEIGYSAHHQLGNCLRLTEDGERCLNGGLTAAEISERRPEGMLYQEPLTKHWPVTERGVFK